MEWTVSLSVSKKTVTMWTLTKEESWSLRQLTQIKAQLAENGYQCEGTPKKVIIMCNTQDDLLEAYALVRTMKI